MDPAGKPVALLPQDKTPKDVAAELDRWVRVINVAGIKDE